MKRIQEDIKNNSFHSLYLLYGDEDYLKYQYKDKLIAAALPPGDTMNLTRFGNDVDLQELTDAVLAMPFFMAARRVVVAEKTGFFKKSPDGFSDLLKSIPESTVLIFVESETDGRSASMNAAKKNGIAVEFGHQDRSTLKTWLASRVKKEGLEITGNAMERFLDCGDEDMMLLDRELEKLICFCLDKGTIDEKDVLSVCIPEVSTNIWKMIDAFAEHDPRAAYAEYNNLLSAKESPFMILSLMERHFRMMLSAMSLDKRGISVQQIAQTLGSRDFAVRNYIRQSRSFSEPDIAGILDRMCELEEKAKTGRLRDAAAVEIVIAEYCS